MSGQQPDQMDDLAGETGVTWDREARCLPWRRAGACRPQR
ncbi:hypothetical protein STRIP9103_07371 [Streptomyces ipomoeae 91-03]|uniref:Uncharacterized protein n=1 Tax=Streptomyces ipomoeae 91-03 TaxID=698759 RepID=L1KMZ5_9ACTN|nr:hypothetical protein STRIP9103_07371 [Streptomyces ipomoeae 91-03]